MIKAVLSFFTFLIFFCNLCCAGIHEDSLLEASNKGDLDGVKAALAQGANVDAQGRFKETSLIIAARRGDSEIVRYLLEQNSDVDQTAIGQTALHKASHWGRTECVEILLNGGAELDLADFYGMNALMKAVSGVHVEAVRILLENGADLDYLAGLGSPYLGLSALQIANKELARYGGANEALEKIIKLLKKEFRIRRSLFKIGEIDPQLESVLRKKLPEIRKELRNYEKP